MTIEQGNQLSDFPPERFTILAFCDACGHQRVLERSLVAAGTTIQELPGRLRCSSCGSRESSIRIVYTGAGGFRIGSSAKTSDPFDQYAR